MSADINTKHQKPQLQSSIRGQGIVLFLLFLMLSASTFNPRSAYARGGPDGVASIKDKRVLVLCSYGYSLPGYQKLIPSFLAALEKAGVSTNGLFIEYLDLLRIKDKEHRQALAGMLRHKYAKTDMDLIVTLHGSALGFFLDEAKDIFPNVPVVSWIVQEAFYSGETGHRIFRIQASLDVTGTLERALELFPKTRRVVFISGVAESERQVEQEAKAVFAKWGDKLQFEYTSGLSNEEMLDRVANLPPQSIVIYWNVFRDKTGRTFVPRDVGEMVAKQANAPVFGLYDTLLGLGVVGGSLLSFEAEGARTGRLALDILNGEISLTEQETTMTGAPVPMFDWKQVEEWGGNVIKLPEASIFINRPLSFWDLYGWYIVGSIGLLLGQSFLIASLLIQRRRGGRAEEELMELNQTLEQRVAERTSELSESEARFRSLFENMTEGVALHEVVYDESGTAVDYTILTVNPAFEAHTGLKVEECRGQLASILYGSGSAPYLDLYATTANSGEPHSFETYFPPLERHFHISVSSPTKGRFVTVFEDITERKRMEEALRASEAHFRALAEALPQIVWTADADGGVEWFNQRWYDYTGEPQPVGEGWSWDKVAHPDEMAHTLKNWREARERGELFQNEIRVRRHDGQYRWFLVRAWPLQDSNGSVIRWFGTNTDIEDIKQAEEQLQKENCEIGLLNRVIRVFAETSGDELFDQVLEIVQEGLASRHGVFGYIAEPGHLICPSLSKMLDVCEIEGKCIHYPPEKWKGRWARALLEKRSLYSNEPSPVPPGHPAIRNNLAAPILFRGEVIGLLNLANKETDYTETDRALLETMGERIAPLLYAWIQKKLRDDERANAEETLRAKEMGLREAQRLAHIGSWHWDAKTDVTTGSDELLRIYGFDPMTDRMPDFQEQRGRCYPIEDWERVNEGVQKALQTGVGYELDVRAIRDSKPIWLTTRSEVIRDADGEISGLRGTVQDITERKRIEEELRKAHDELELRVRERTADLQVSNKALMEYAAKLERLNEELQEFAFVASHDLQEPLRKIQTFGNMLAKNHQEDLGEQGKDYLTRITRAAKRMSDLLRSLLDYSRIATHPSPFEPVNLEELAWEAVSDLELAIQKVGGSVDIGELPVIEADAAQFRQLVQNLVANSMKYCRDCEKPVVKIYGHTSGTTCTILFEDNGIGFEEEYVDRIFRPFQQLHGRSAGYEGTGMGLAICRKIVERHEGSITAKSTPGQGTTFIVQLPMKLRERSSNG
jgi:PAS domain S-box-containing protein